MTHTQRITRNEPGCIILLLDQSGSMDELIGDGSGLAKKDVLVRCVNRLFAELIKEAFRQGELKHYFDFGVVGYGGPYEPEAMPVLGATFNGDNLCLDGPLAAPQLSGDPVSLPLLANNCIRQETRERMAPDGDGGTIPITVHSPVWVEAAAKYLTPMRDGFLVVNQIANRWAMSHPASLPPIVVHVTDGVYTGDDPSDAIHSLKSITTNHGEVLLFNIHLSTSGDRPLFLPSSMNGVSDQYAQQLFSWSSQLPSSFILEAQKKGHEIQEGAHGFAFNADSVQLSQLLDIGTPTTKSTEDRS